MPAREEDIKLQILSLTISQDGRIEPSMAHRMKILVQVQTFINSLNLIIWDSMPGKITPQRKQRTREILEEHRI